MSKEQYVSYENTKLLREKGFRGDCIAYYNEDGRRCLSLNAELLPLPCPTQAVACRWLREEKKIHIELELCVDDDFSFAIHKIDGNRTYLYQEMRYWKKAEDAIEAGLKYCLENLV